MAIKYRYNIELRYPYNGKEYTIPQTSIKSLVISYDYDNCNMPIIILKCVLDKNIIDDMVLNNKKKYITLKLSKYKDETALKINQSYIYDQFTYFLDSNTINSRKNIDYANNTTNNEDIYQTISIGLMLQSLIDNNKQIIEGVHTNQTLLEILLCYLTNYMKILIEDPNKNDLNNSIIPTFATVTSFIKYIDNQYGIYDTPYRLFYDFDKSYLLSSSGKGVPSKDEKYNTIIFNVHNINSLESKNFGIEEDNKNNSYNIDIATTDIDISENTATSKTYGTIIGIDKEGNTITENLDLEGSDSSNIRIERTNNLAQISSLKNKIETNNITVNITKTELDASIFTINKEIYIKNYDKLNNQIGKFIMVSKKEIYTYESNSFICSLLLTLKKVNS